MALQSSGAISLSNVNTELGNSSSAQISLGSTAVRDLAGVSSGAISFSDLYGKSAVWQATLTCGNTDRWLISRWQIPIGQSGYTWTTTTITQNESDLSGFDGTSTGYFDDYLNGNASTSYYYYDQQLDNFGSISDSTFEDGGGTTRTVLYLVQDKVRDKIYFGLSGTGIPDSNTTFTSIKINGTTYNRSARSSYLSSYNGLTYWVFDEASTRIPDSGTIDIEIDV